LRYLLATYAIIPHQRSTLGSKNTIAKNTIAKNTIAKNTIAKISVTKGLNLRFVAKKTFAKFSVTEPFYNFLGRKYLQFIIIPILIIKSSELMK